MQETWLPLTDYSSKYRVSVSTLRRRIKAEDIQFRFENGKYFIFDGPLGAHSRAHRPSLKSESAPSGTPQEPMAPVELEKSLALATSKDEPVLSAANKLLNELKRAYTQILQEKEEQILELKEEVSDLKTLVRVLESENLRLRGN